MFEVTYYTVGEAARRFGVPVGLFIRLIEEKHIDAIRLSNSDYRVTHKEMERIDDSELFKDYKYEDESEDEES
jgi:excisionase family DNA binding protein